MSRRWLAAGLAVASLLAGCGVPDRTGVTIDGPVAQRGAPGADAGPREPHKPADARSDEELVRYFLQAAAGDSAGAPDRLRKFLIAPAAWQPGTAVIVVRVSSIRAIQPVGDAGKVDVSMQPVGRLTPTGSVAPLSGAETQGFTWHFEVGPGEIASSRRYIVNPPSAMYLDSTALTEWYEPHSIYFWDTTGATLVPDLRYLPLSIPQPARPTQIVRWVLDGPSEWLQPVVRALPEGIDLLDQAVPDAGRLVVNLNAVANEVPDPQLLLTQLRWSLRETYRGPVVLQIERLPRAEGTPDDHVSANRADTMGDPVAYCIVDGRVLRADGQECDRDAALPAGLAPEINTRVTAAAITREENQAAVVQGLSNGRAQLAVSQTGTGQSPTFANVGPSVAQMGRPVWLTSPAAAAGGGLVPVNGELHEFTTGAVPRLRSLDTGLVGVSAVAVAPDGRRVAIAAGGRVYVATIGLAGGSVSIGPLRELPSSVGGIVGVGWSRQDRVVVGGRTGDGAAIAEITVDGAVEALFNPGLEALTISHLVAFPSNPGSTAPGAVMIQANGTAWIVFVTSYGSMRVPAPASQSPGSTTAAATAAFFAD